jgi:hypothetical protein
MSSGVPTQTTRILANLAACGWTTARFHGTSDAVMQVLVSDGLACVKPAGVVRLALDAEYGLTRAGRTKLESIKHG